MTGFADRFGHEPDACWRAPGRVNVIGEHTDYNDGFVLPIALPLGITAAVGRRDDGQVRALSTSGDEAAQFAVDGLRAGSVEGWTGYVAGVVWALDARGHRISGADVLIDGDLPPGAGLSSSAALECSVAAALAEAFGSGLSRSDLVAVARAAENDFVGVPTGPLDQSASVFCEDGCALLLDTRSGERRQVRFDVAGAGLALLVIDTRAPHQLVDGEYAQRRADCEAAAHELGVPALRDVGVRDVSARLGELSTDRLRRRVRHVVTENARVLDVVQALDSGAPVAAIGPLLTASHASLRDDYEVSSRELDVAVDSALRAGAYGARMTGGGFGGSAIALADADRAAVIGDAVRAAFAAAGLAEPDVFPAVPSQGAHRVPAGSVEWSESA